MTQKLSWVVRLALRFFRSRLKNIEGEKYLPTGAFLVAANHVDFLDGFAIGAALVAAGRPAPVVPTQTSNYTWTGLTLPIDPTNRSATLDRAKGVLERGGVILNFPEGQRTPDGRLQPGKTGTVRLALAANVPIIPTAILGPRRSHYFLGSVWQYLTRGRFVTVRFGEAMHLVPISNPTHDDLARLTQELMERIERLVRVSM